jgi:hypothetical protein
MQKFTAREAALITLAVEEWLRYGEQSSRARLYRATQAMCAMPGDFSERVIADAPVTRGEVQELLRKVVGADALLEPPG